MDNAKRQITVTVPGHVKNLPKARRFVKEKWDWIQVQLETVPKAQPFVDNGQILFRGEIFTVINDGPRGRPRIDYDERFIYVPAPQGSLRGRTQRLLIREARAILTERTRHYADILGKPVDSISVRDTRSRWGSCKKGNARKGGEMSYSWRLVCAPPFVLDYVAAHECAHLVHAHHGKEFWDLCEDLFGNPKTAKRLLSQNGAELHAVGADY